MSTISKEEKILEAAFELFISKGINETTIQDIVHEAGIAKGTYYLYFKNKYELVETLVLTKTVKLFKDAIEASHKIHYMSGTAQLLYIIDYIIDELSEDQKVLKFISKNLSIGAYNIYKTESLKENVSQSIYEIFLQRIKEDSLNVSNPRVTFFMIIELVGSTCYNAILFEKPLPIKEYKPYLYEAIKKLLQ